MISRQGKLQEGTGLRVRLDGAASAAVVAFSSYVIIIRPGDPSEVLDESTYVCYPLPIARRMSGAQRNETIILIVILETCPGSASIINIVFPLDFFYVPLATVRLLPSASPPPNKLCAPNTVYQLATS